MEMRKGFVEIPKTTLNALKGLLFTKDEGVDLSSIINDVTLDEDTKDLTAINVALVYKGLAPKIDTTTRYSKSWKTLSEHTFVRYSLILNVVTTLVKDYRVNREGTELVMEREHIDHISLDQWEEMTTDREQFVADLCAESNK